MDVKSASRRVLRLGKIQRRPELDALRGLFLVWMTLTHLPTRLSEVVNQPFGFVSSAEGFVFLSAMLVATLYIHQAAEDSEGVRPKLWKRGHRIAAADLLPAAAGHPAHVRHFPAADAVHPECCRAPGLEPHSHHQRPD